MVKKAVWFLFLSVWTLSFVVHGFSLGAPDDDPQSDKLRSIAPNVFLDCSRRDCDLDYIRTEITFVNYVRDPQSSDVHILVTRQSTGSGGREYTLSFMGKGKYEGRDSSLKYYSKSMDTQDQIRKGFVNVMKQGLIPYLYDTPLSEFITVSYTQKAKRLSAPVQDKWNYWVFYTSFRGNLNFEEQSKRYSYSVSLSANRTTEATKFRFWANGNFNERRYIISEDDEVISRSARKTVWTQLIRSIDDHWSYGASASFYSSTYDNAALFTTIGPAIEYNIFPYDQATRRELRIQYRLDFSIRNYDEITIYDKTRENLFSQLLQVVWEMKEPWGSLGVQLRGSTFLHDWSKNNLQLEAGISMRILKGLSFNVEGEYSRVRDQLALPKRDASVEEILLEIRRLATSYDLRLQMGFSFRFGSIYSNVVNPRFGNR
ncbi:MAG: hypothetical protein JSV17_01945 [Candidatus Aminicenantes bacterium]|nr:MAG: hypothetical protein JSV17_01945 [Candidatus Aminicenantes bacterium]